MSGMNRAELKDADCKILAATDWANSHRDDIDFLKKDSVIVAAAILTIKVPKALLIDDLLESVITIMCYAFYLGRTSKILQDKQ